tara:strand:+ start:4689 stop:5381 length:693 start_codon:yes stop_codon:yes gene_type:complete
MHMYGITETCTDLFTALIKAQSQMGSAVKDAKNPHFRSRYASLAAVIDAVIPVLNANGVGVLQLPSIEGSEVQLTTILMHSSGQRLSSTVGAPLGKKQDAQAVGSAITYLRRYSLQSIMGLPVEDDDGNAASRPQRRQPQRRQVPETAAPTVADKAFAAVRLEAAKDWAALIAAELEGAGLTVQQFNVWAMKSNRQPLGGMTPTNLKNCYSWLEHGNGLEIIKATITERV